MTADEIRILHAGERLSANSGLFADIMRGEPMLKEFRKPGKILRGLTPVLNVGLQGESGVAAATLPHLCQIVARVRQIAPLN